MCPFLGLVGNAAPPPIKFTPALWSSLNLTIFKINTRCIAQHLGILIKLLAAPSWYQESLRFHYLCSQGDPKLSEGAQNLFVMMAVFPLFSWAVLYCWFFWSYQFIGLQFASAQSLENCSCVLAVNWRQIIEGSSHSGIPLSTTDCVFMTWLIFLCRGGDINIEAIGKNIVRIDLLICLTYSPCHIVTLHSDVHSTSWRRGKRW